MQPTDGQAPITPAGDTLGQRDWATLREQVADALARLLGVPRDPGR